MQYFTYQRALRALIASSLVACLHLGVAHADVPLDPGPAPDSASLAAPGGFGIDQHVIARATARAFGYGGATVYYPKAAHQKQTFGIVTLTPGYTGEQTHYRQLAQHIASHGFVVINLDTQTIYDVPDSRARQMSGALRQVITMAAMGKAPFSSVTDITRRGMVGHSMGGGGTLSAAASDNTLKAVVPLTPWHTTKNFPRIKVPTLIVACQNDTVASNGAHADRFYASLASDVPRGEVEVKGAGHLCPTTGAYDHVRATVGKSVIAWLKRFLDGDMRYDALVKGGMNDDDFSRFKVAGF